MTAAVCLLDSDGTLRPGHLILDWARHLAREGAISEHFVNNMESTFEKYTAGAISYAAMAHSVVQAYATALKGSRNRQIESHVSSFVDAHSKGFPFSIPLVEYLIKQRIEPIVITGSPSIVSIPFAAKLGIDRCYGLELDSDKSGILLGTYQKNTALRENKRLLLRKILKTDNSVQLAVGDSVEDIALFEAAKRAYYLRSDPERPVHLSSKLISLRNVGRLRVVFPEELLRLIENDEILA